VSDLPVTAVEANHEPAAPAPVPEAPPALLEVESPTPPAPSAQPLVAEISEPVAETPALVEPPAAPKPILEFDWQTDLTQIETDRQKLMAAQSRTQEEPPAPRTKRERRALPPVSDEPLVQVETQNGQQAARPEDRAQAETSNAAAG
jgi:ribonuclease E